MEARDRLVRERRRTFARQIDQDRTLQLPFVNSANGGSKTLRNVPNIGGDANTDNYICANGTCAGGYGRTIFASPILAGFVALANQQAAAAGLPPVGFLNPALYRLAGKGSAGKLFHDETRGRSGLFKCTPSFNLVTGVGPPEGPH